MQPTDAPAGAVRIAFADGTAGAITRPVAAEWPVNLVYGTVPYAVMMLTPDDLEDFARGFSLTEGIIEAPSDITGVAAEHGPDGIRLRVGLVPARLHGLLARRRAMAGRTSCGVCGIEDLASLPRATTPIRPGLVHLHAIERALRALPDHQPLNRRTGAAHAAAWATPDGTVALAREDVGRHNALDKLIGAALAAGTDPAHGFLLVTSRCSYEMVEKAAAFGAHTLVAISAPTRLGINRAAHHGLTLIGLARPDSLLAFTGADRILRSQDQAA